MWLAAAAVAAVVLTAITAPTFSGPLASLLAGATPDLSRAVEPLDLGAAASWWLSGTFLTEPLGTALALALWLAVFGLMSLATSTPRRGADGGLPGDSALKTGREGVKAGDVWDGRREPASRGYVYGYSGGMLYEGRAPHCICVGSTGSGKTRSQVIPTLDLLTYGAGGWNVVVSDVKGELLELCGDGLRARGYDILLLDCQHPMRGGRYDPLALVVARAEAGDVMGATQAADEVACALVPSEGPDGADRPDHWATSARNLLSAAILAVAFSEECPRNLKALPTVCRVINEGTEAEGADPARDLKRWLSALPRDHPAREFSSQLISSGGNELRSVLSTLKARTRLYASGPAAWMTSGNDVSPERALTGRVALFLRVMDEGSPYNALFAVYFDQLYREAHRLADENGGRIPRETALVLDELGNLPEIRSLPGLLSLGRSYGLHFYGTVQNLGQLNRYGERTGRRKILANCDVKVGMKLSEREEREYFSELVGKTTRRSKGTSSSRAASGATSGVSFSEREADVVRAAEWVTHGPEEAVVIKQALAGERGHARSGALLVPQADCTAMPTRTHFGLGSREHEAARRLAAQRALDAKAATEDPAVRTWAPDWTAFDVKADPPLAEGAAPEDDAPEDEWSAFD